MEKELIEEFRKIRGVYSLKNKALKALYKLNENNDDYEYIEKDGAHIIRKK